MLYKRDTRRDRQKRKDNRRIRGGEKMWPELITMAVYAGILTLAFIRNKVR